MSSLTSLCYLGWKLARYEKNAGFSINMPLSLNELFSITATLIITVTVRNSPKQSVTVQKSVNWKIAHSNLLQRQGNYKLGKEKSRIAFRDTGFTKCVVAVKSHEGTFWVKTISCTSIKNDLLHNELNDINMMHRMGMIIMSHQNFTRITVNFGWITIRFWFWQVLRFYSSYINMTQSQVVHSHLDKSYNME